MEALAFVGAVSIFAGLIWVVWALYDAGEPSPTVASGYVCSVALPGEPGHLVDMVPERIECVRE